MSPSSTPGLYPGKVQRERDEIEHDEGDKQTMLKLSELLVGNSELTSFEDLIPMVQAVAMDVKPPFPDTPDNWEDRLEAAFSGPIR